MSTSAAVDAATSRGTPITSSHGTGAQRLLPAWAAGPVAYRSTLAARAAHPAGARPASPVSPFVAVSLSALYRPWGVARLQRRVAVRCAG